MVQNRLTVNSMKTLELAWIFLSDNWKTQPHLRFDPINKKVSPVATKYYVVESS